MPLETQAFVHAVMDEFESRRSRSPTEVGAQCPDAVASLCQLRCNNVITKRIGLPTHAPPHFTPCKNIPIICNIEQVKT